MDNNDQEKNMGKKVDSIFLISKKKKALENFVINKKFFSNPRPLKRKVKIILSLVLFFLFFIVPIKIINTGEGLRARASELIVNINSIYPTLKSGDYKKAGEDFKTIENNITSIQNDLNSIGQKNIFASSLPFMKSKIASNEALLDIAYLGTKIAAQLTDDLAYLNSQNIGGINSNESNLALFERMKKINTSLKESRPDFDLLKSKLGKLDIKNLDKEIREKVKPLKENVETISIYYEALIAFTENFSGIFGGDYEKKYLILFQNNTELRATGGFIGTYGIITIKDAKIKNFFIDSIYNPDGQATQKIEPPKPLKKITGNLTMRDANWDPDFPSSANSISRLYEMEGGFTPDGVIAIDTKPFIDLLKITGPIKLEKYGVEINADNFVELTQYKTSVDYDSGAGNPKKFLAEFAPIFLNKVFENESKSKGTVYLSMLKNIQENHIALYSPSQSIESIYSSLGISGEIKSLTTDDFFYYVDSNIGGLKTNDKITESLEHQIEVLDDKITHKVKLTRKHAGTFDWPSGINYAYLRFYIPKDAEIINTNGFEKDESIKKNPLSGMIFLEEKEGFYKGKASIQDLDTYQEHDKKVIGAWQVIKPGESMESEVEYSIPHKKGGKDYSLLIQKQYGANQQRSSIILKKGGITKKEEFDLLSDKLVSFQF